MAEPQAPASGAAQPPQSPPSGAGAPATNPPANNPPAAPSAEEIRAQVLADFARELKETTGHESLGALKAARELAEQERLKVQGEFQKLAEQAQAERDQYRQRYEASTVASSILAAAAAAIDPEVVQGLLAARAKVGADGQVTVDGKPVATAVEDLLKAKPFLAKPVGGAGSGSGAGAGGSGATGPEQMTMAQLQELKARDPGQYWTEMQRRAGAGRSHG